MIGRRRLTDRERWQAVGQLDVGRRQIDVAANFGVSQSVVCRLYQRKQQTGEVAERRGRGVHGPLLHQMTVTFLCSRYVKGR